MIRTLHAPITVAAAVRTQGSLWVAVGYTAVAVFLLWATVLTSVYPAPDYADWQVVFFPAARALLSGSPYAVHGFFNPPWALLPVLPFLLPELLGLPEAVGAVLLKLCSLAATVYVLRRFGTPYSAIALTLLSAPAIAGLVLGNIDALVLLGAVTPAPISLLLLTAKPQVGLGILLYQLCTRRYSLRLLLVFGVFAAGTLLLWEWPRAMLSAGYFNVGLFPYAVPVGLACLFRLRSSLAAGPLLSPYCSLTSLIGVVIACSSRWQYALIATAASWVLWGVRFSAQ